ncbi:hypothetical protein [Maribacter sp. HTCC2170]|uniref:hypothetical protein n=1 Tax=Maribacter sp. (strain HTCC2170 / KCCM 42371) TaxID=313603 RepID=UPI00006B1AF6|nr:hypothetical protein [Maribacter sp. HTCC2170]EAR00808.1 hypothetical protein FB2170_17026 [Maribacter sp. HTCC2170]
MRVITIYLVVFFSTLAVQNVISQEEDYQQKVEFLLRQKEQISLQEKEALKFEVEQINKRYEKNQISYEESKVLKETAAKKRALNIENRVAIVENEILLLERNHGEVLDVETIDSTGISSIEINFDFKRADGSSLLWEKRRRIKRELKYDRRTYSDFVMAIGLNNALIDGRSINDSPYKIGGSRFFEMGWSWRTRVFENTNFLRLNYGFSFQFNGLKPKNNQYFVAENGQVELQDFEFDLKKSKIRMDNLVFPVHLEFGPSKLHKTDKTMRYSLRNQFRLGIGAYGGFNMGTRQKLKYNRNGENVKDKLKRGYNTNDLVYGLSAYVGFDGVLLYAKYDLNPIFKDALIEQNNISLGLRFDL